MQQIWQWIPLVLSTVVLLLGSLACLGYAQMSRVLPKEHILNRAYGGAALLFGAGILLIGGVSPLTGEYGFWKWTFSAIGALMMINSGVLLSKLNMELRRLSQTGKK